MHQDTNAATSGFWPGERSRSPVVHDAHTAALMLEHSVRTI